MNSTAASTTWIASSRNVAKHLFTSLFALLPLGALANEPPPSKPAVAVVVTQAVGVGTLADHLAELATDDLAKLGHTVIRPGEAARRLREAKAPDPLTCGTDTACLRSLAESLEAHAVVALGVGRFAGMYGLDIRSVPRHPDGAPKTHSGTWAEPGPDWMAAIHEAVRQVAPEIPAPVGKLFVHTDTEGAEIRIDGEVAGLSPLAQAVELPVGAHRLEVVRPGVGGAERTVEIVEGETLELSLALAPLHVDRSPAWIAPAKWTTGAVAIASLTGAIATHLSASSTMDDARADKAAGRPFAQTRRDALDTLTNARILYGLAAAAGIGSGVLFWLDAGQPTAPAAAAP